MVKDNGSEIKNFEFQQFNEPKNGIKGFDFQEFKEGEVLDSVDSEVKIQTIRQEREAAAATNFRIMDHVKSLRGLKDQEVQDYENRIQKDLQSRVGQIRKESEEEGYKAGFEAGEKKAYEEGIAKANEQILEMEKIIQSLQEQKIEMLTSFKKQIFVLVRQFTKWFTLKEVSTDHEYLERVIEKLIHEINTKSNLILKVNKADFESIPNAIENVEQKIGKLSNIRVEIEQDMNGRGVIIESDRGIIDGSIHAQFESFDKVFESVGLDGDN